MSKPIAAAANYARFRPLAFALGVTYAGLVGSPAAVAQVPVPVGTAFRVNVVTANDQVHGVPAMDAAGNFVVVWSSDLQDGSQTGVFGRRFSSAGAPLASEFQINTYTSGFQFEPVVDMTSTGAWVVVWGSFHDGSEAGVFGRRFDSGGGALASEFQVNSYTLNYQSFPEVAMAGGGDFVVAWESERNGADYDVFARRFNAAGAPQGQEFKVNTLTVGDQRQADIDVEADGDFVITWSSGPIPYSIHGQRFNSVGVSQGLEIQISAYTGHQGRSRIRLEADGDFVVVWHNYDQYGGEADILGRRFNSLGAPAGSEFQINSYLIGSQSYPSLAAEADGDFAVFWQSNLQDGNMSGVFGRRLWASASIMGPEVRANVQTNGNQAGVAVASDSDGDFIVVWNDSFGAAGMNVFARRFEVPAMLDIDGDGQVLPLTDGLLSLRFSFGFTGSTLTTDAIAAGCTRCDATAIEAYLHTLQ